MSYGPASGGILWKAGWRTALLTEVAGSNFVTA